MKRKMVRKRSRATPLLPHHMVAPNGAAAKANNNNNNNRSRRTKKSRGVSSIGVALQCSCILMLAMLGLYRMAGIVFSVDTNDTTNNHDNTQQPSSHHHHHHRIFQRMHTKLAEHIPRYHRRWKSHMAKRRNFNQFTCPSSISSTDNNKNNNNNENDGIHSSDNVQHGIFSQFRNHFQQHQQVAYLNDDYCDCWDDGSDEPETSACAHISVQTAVFRCHDGSGSVYASRVRDGFQDCPDGSDELPTGSGAATTATTG